MASIKWYLTATTSGGWRTIDEASQVAANLTDGWTVGTGNTFSSEYQVGVKRAATTFIANTVPDGTLDTSLFDGFRTTLAYTGTFGAGVPWFFDFKVRTTTAVGHAGAIVMRLLRSANANGSGATEITSGQQVCNTTAAQSSTTQDYLSSATPTFGAITLSNEYLFIQIAWKRVTAASMTTADVVFRTGTNTPSGTVIESSNFVPAAAGGFAHSFATMTG
jgi:hypothetical protein